MSQEVIKWLYLTHFDPPEPDFIPKDKVATPSWLIEVEGLASFPVPKAPGATKPWRAKSRISSFSSIFSMLFESGVIVTGAESDSVIAKTVENWNRL